MRWSSRRMRSTRSSALRCPSCRRNTLRICSRLLERLPPSGLRRSTGRVITSVVSALALARDAEGLAAAAGRSGVRVLDGKPAAGDRLDEIHFGALEIADADRIDEQPHAVRFVDLVADAAVLLNHEP